MLNRAFSFSRGIKDFNSPFWFVHVCVICMSGLNSGLHCLLLTLQPTSCLSMQHVITSMEIIAVASGPDTNMSLLQAGLLALIPSLFQQASSVTVSTQFTE